MPAKKSVTVRDEIIFQISKIWAKNPRSSFPDILDVYTQLARPFERTYLDQLTDQGKKLLRDACKQTLSRWAAGLGEK